MPQIPLDAPRYLAMTYPELKEAAIKALKENNLTVLSEVRIAVVHFFMNELYRNDPQSKQEFIWMILECIESVRKVVPEEHIRESFVRELGLLCDMLVLLRNRDNGGLYTRARKVFKRKNVGELLKKIFFAVAKSKHKGVKLKTLRNKFALEETQLNNLLNILEKNNLIDPWDGVSVKIGLVGQVVLERVK